MTTRDTMTNGLGLYGTYGVSVLVERVGGMSRDGVEEGEQGPERVAVGQRQQSDEQSQRLHAPRRRTQL